ncbi:MAG: secretin N-terminal domain-containing protein [Verrucomicrobiota bacterium]|nr:secretin N-terminal domain-containing protein [Verrucomicrobiota bacterium]
MFKLINSLRQLLATLIVANAIFFGYKADAETINWVNVPIGEFVIPRYEAISGKRLMVDGSVSGSSITINSQIDMPPEEAIEFIKGSLLLNGFAIIEKDEKTDVLINAASKSPVGIKLDPRIYLTAEDLPDGDRIVTYVMKFDYISPEDALRVFQVVSRPNPYSTIAPVANVNAIVVTDNVPLVRTLVRLKEEIDVPGTGVTPESIPLIRADAQEVASSLNEILQSQSSSRSGANSTSPRTNVVISPTGRAPAPGSTNANNTNPQSAPDGNTIQIQAISRTNSILVIARPVDIAYIKSLVGIFDAPSEIENFLKRELKYIPVSDFIPVASDALSRYVDDSARSSGRTSSSSSRRTSTTSRTSSGLTGSSRSSGLSSSSRGTTGGFSGTNRGSSLGGSSISNSSPISGPESILIGNTLLIGDSQLNNVVVSGPPEHLRIIDQLLDEIDIRPRQVYINAVIAQVSLGDDIKFGKDLLRTVEEIDVGGEKVNVAGSFRTTAGGSGVIDVANLAAVADAFPRPDGLGIWGQVGDYFNAYIQALENTNRFEVISRPFVFTANNQLASIASGERVAVPTQSVSSQDAGGTVSSSIGFEEVLLRLDVLPLINSKDEVTLTVSQENENITGTTVIGGNEVPDIATQQFETTVRLPNKAIVVLGGIIQEDDNETVSGLPFLTKIPLIKNILGSTSKQKNRRELLIFLQPTIIETTDDLIEKNIKEIRETLVGEKAIDSASPKPEMDSSLFPMGKSGILGRGGKTFIEPPLPQEEPALPAQDVPQKAKEKKKGIFSNFFRKNTGEKRKKIFRKG